jgi:hypothetical protein
MRTSFFALAIAIVLLFSCDAIIKTDTRPNKVSLSLTGRYSPNYNPDEHPSYSNIHYQFDVIIQKAYDSTGVIQGAAIVFSDTLPAPDCSVLFIDRIPLDEAYIVVIASGTGDCFLTSDHYSGDWHQDMPLVQTMVRLSELSAGTPHVETLGSGLAVTVSLTSY